MSVPGYVCMYVKICASPLCVCVCVHVCICITCILVTWVHEYLDSCAFPYVCVCAHVTLQMCQCPKGCIVSIRGHAHHESESESHSVSPTLCNPVVYTVRGIFQARILEWVASPFSRGSSQPRDQTQVSHIAGGLFYQLSHQGSPAHHEVQLYVL